MPKRRAIWIFLAILLLYPVSYMVIISTQGPNWEIHALKNGLNNPINVIEWEWQPFSKFADPNPLNDIYQILFTPLIKLDRLIWHQNKTTTFDRRKRTSK